MKCESTLLRRGRDTLDPHSPKRLAAGSPLDCRVDAFFGGPVRSEQDDRTGRTR
jgi:hypothetical protein